MLSTEKQETVIKFKRNVDTATIYTSDTETMQELEEIHARKIGTVKDGEKLVTAVYEVDRDCLVFKSAV